MRKTLTLLLAGLFVLLAACATPPGKKVDMIGEYGNAVRWSDWDMAWKFVDPAMRTSMELPPEEADRLQNIKVTGYQVHSSDPQPDGTLLQLVDIHYIEQSTQKELVAHSRQIWRTDDGGEHWWLTTGLPHFE